MIYDKIIADGLKTAIKNPENKSIYKEIIFFSLLFANSANFILIVAILENYIFYYQWYKIDFIIFKTEFYDSILKYFILFVLPFIPINYFLIYYKKRYERLLKYPDVKGKLFFLYFIISICLPTIGVIIVYLLQ
jgi:hypothetical protein